MNKIFFIIAFSSIRVLACNQMGWSAASAEMNRIAKANNAKSYYWSLATNLGDSYQWDFLVPQNSAPLIGTVIVSEQTCEVIRSAVTPAIGKVNVN